MKTLYDSTDHPLLYSDKNQMIQQSNACTFPMETNLSFCKPVPLLFFNKNISLIRDQAIQVFTNEIYPDFTYTTTGHTLKETQPRTVKNDNIH